MPVQQSYANGKADGDVLSGNIPIINILEVSCVVCQTVWIPVSYNYDFLCSEIFLTTCICGTSSSEVIYGGSNFLDPFDTQHP